jgi:hypothetical protein
VAGDLALTQISRPATGIVDYSIVKDHSRPSPGSLPRFIADLFIWIDVSRSRRRAFLPARVIEPRNEKSRRGRLHLGGFRRNL